MVSPGEIHVWLVFLDQLPEERLPRPGTAELERASAFASTETALRYLRAHQALRQILQTVTSAELQFAVTEKGKPYLVHVPEVDFNLSRSHEMALVAVALGGEVGVDVERLRALPELESIVAHFFPAREAAEWAAQPVAHRERDFFRRWTRLEAMWKALGIGLYGAGQEAEGEWTVEEIPVGGEFVAAVAARRAGMRVLIHNFGEDE